MGERSYSQAPSSAETCLNYTRYLAPKLLLGQTPSSAFVGSVTSVTITGTNFVTPATVTFSGVGVTAGTATVVSPTSITCNFTIAGDAVAGARNVYVTVYGSISQETVTFTATDYATLTVPGSVTIPATPPLIRTQANDSAAQTVSAASSLDSNTYASVTVSGTNSGKLTSAAPTSLSSALKLSGTGFTEVTALSGADQTLVNTTQGALTLVSGVGSWTKTTLIVTQPIFDQVAAGSYTCTITFTAVFGGP